MSTLNVDKVDPNTGTALEIGTSGDTITVPSGATFVVAGTTEITGTNNVQRPNVDPILINGAMNVAQRGTSFTGVTSGSNYTSDRFDFLLANLGTWTIIQEALTSGDAFADGFSKAFRVDCTTADASPASADYVFFKQKLEGSSVQAFKKGTANAQPFTLSFWVKSNKTGTFQVNLLDEDNDRMVSGTYAISVADTWEKKIINFPADTTGAWDNDNAMSLEVEFPLDAGSSYSSGTAPSAWETKNNADRNANDLALGDNTANDWAITAVQLEVGTYTSSTIPPFQHESYGNNLERCQRYYYLHAANTSSGDVGVGGYYSSSYIFFNVTFPCNMRTAPSLVYVSGTDYYKIIGISTTDYFNDILGGGSGTTNEINFYNNSQISGTEGGAGFVRTNNTSASIALNAEL